MPARSRRLARLALLALAGAALLALGLAAWVVAGSGLADPEPAAAIVVLGAAAYGQEPSPILAARLDHGIDLFRRGKAPLLVLTGGRAPGAPAAESEVGRAYALARGVPPAAIRIETRSATTRENLAEARALIGPASIILVSDPLHMARAKLLAREAGLAAETSPTPTTRIRSWLPWLRFLVREVWFSALAALGRG